MPNGYSLRAMSSTEVYVANPQRELLLGPTVIAIGVVGDHVVAFCGWERRVANGFQNTIGYNIIDTRSGAVVRKLTEAEARAWMESQRLAFPSMRSPSELMTTSL